MCLPLQASENAPSPLKTLEHRLHPWVAFLILPVFAFFNSGFSFKDLSLSSLSHPVALGIALGLFVGKQSGVMLFSYLACRSKICALPQGTRWGQFYGMAIVTGIGFTMSLFIGALAFSEPGHQNLVKLGVVVGRFFQESSGILFFCTAVDTTPKKSYHRRLERRGTEAVITALTRNQMGVHSPTRVRIPPSPPVFVLRTTAGRPDLY